MHRSLLLALLVLPLGCTDTPTAPADPIEPSFAKAEATTSSMVVPLDQLAFVPCAADGAGELVMLSGSLHVLSHVTENGNRFRAVSHFNPQKVTGTGMTTGTVYQGTGVSRETFSGSFTNGQYTETFIDNFRLIAKAGAESLKIHETFHVTVNANGEVTAVVEQYSADCS
jgi:hypothetical protein